MITPKEWYVCPKRIIYTATHHNRSEVLQKRFDDWPKTLHSLQQSIEKNFHAKTIFTQKKIVHGVQSTNT
jgi:hypothetical protein